MHKLIIENKTDISEDTLLGIARRQNNSKRAYLIVNKLQAKHIPAPPTMSLKYFSQLGRAAAETRSGSERILVIGFSETATAIGAAVANEIPNALYGHTTREPISSLLPLARFLEEHSHAANHDFFARPEFDMKNIERIVFVDDEISTGRTVLNFIAALKESGRFRPSVRFTAASLIQSAHAARVLQNAGVDVCYLTLIDAQRAALPDGEASECHQAFDDGQARREIVIKCGGNPRTTERAYDYMSECEQFASYAAAELDIDGGTVLVLGTEEFMFPALMLGAAIERRIPDVFCHATTRSPIAAYTGDSYPIRSQYAFPSLYDTERTSYIYNLRRYGTVVVATDAPQNPVAQARLFGALHAAGNDNIFLVRWSL